MQGIKGCVLALALLAMGGCAHKEGERLGEAAATPLSDLNLLREKIPLVLQQAQAQPYQLPQTLSCDELVPQIRALDKVLGADLDTPPSQDNPSLIDRGGEAVGNAAVGAVSRTAEGVIPFRGWVRKLTGAERHSRKVAAAITAGTARRAFLKGVASTRECTWNPARLQAAAPSSGPDDPAAALARPD